METVWAWFETQTNADVVALIQREYTTITYAWRKYRDGKHVHVRNTRTQRGISLYQGPAGDKGGLTFHLLDEHAGTHQLYYRDKGMTCDECGLYDGHVPVPSGIDGFYVQETGCQLSCNNLVMVPYYGTIPIESVYRDALRALL